jgi:16S rRNA (guanine966-N2)-methyltransferase
MRIIAGERRGHKFDGPEGSDTRPTSEMVREAIFNILADRPEDRTVYDLFAGSGALGLESLSRGSNFAIFIEKDRRNHALIKRNIATLKYEGRGSIIVTDAYRWVETYAPENAEPVLVLIDPPYVDFKEKPAKIRAMISTLVEKLPKGSTIVVESERDPESEALPDPELWDVRRYGRTQTAFRDLDDDEAADAVEDE